MIDNMEFSYIHINEAKKIKIDYYCSLASLPLAFNTTIDTIPGFFKKYENEKLLGLALRNGYIQAFPCQ